MPRTRPRGSEEEQEEEENEEQQEDAGVTNASLPVTTQKNVGEFANSAKKLGI